MASVTKRTVLGVWSVDDGKSVRYITWTDAQPVASATVVKN